MNNQNKPGNRKQKIDLLKGIISGKVSVKETLNPKVYIVYSLEPESSDCFTEDGIRLTRADMKRIEEEEGKRPVMWINVVSVDRVFKLPHNNRNPIPEDAIIIDRRGEAEKQHSI